MNDLDRLIRDTVIRVVAGPRVDWLAVAGAVLGTEAGFVETVTPRGRPILWRPGVGGAGWWAKEYKRHGRIILCAHTEKGGYVWPQDWIDEHGQVVTVMKPTRVDICCDIEGFTFLQEHRSLFTMRTPHSSNHYHGVELETLNIGGDSAHVNMKLRIYNKTRECDERDRQQWAKNGWTGGDVWRVEYQINERALPRELELPRDVDRMWADALARYRMCAVDPRTYSQQNKAPTHDVWTALGSARKLTRRRSAMPPPRDEARHLRSLERLMEAAGPRLLPRLLAKLKRAHDVSVACGEIPHGENENDETA